MWADTAAGSIQEEFDVRNLDYALSRQPGHCQEPDAYGKWVWDEWETSSGKPGYEFFLYAEGSDEIYMSIYCRGDEPGDKSVQFVWGERRPLLADDPYQIKRSDGTLHSSSHPVKIRYGDGIAQSESWQLVSKEITSRNRSLPSAYVGEGGGRIVRYRQVDTLTVWTDTESGETIHAEFDVRRLDKALARLNESCR